MLDERNHSESNKRDQESSYLTLEDIFNDVRSLRLRPPSALSDSLDSDSDFDGESDGEAEFGYPPATGYSGAQMASTNDTDVQLTPVTTDTPDEIQVPTEPTLPTEPTPPMAITAEMSLSEVLMHLKEHGCKDITSALDIFKCSEYPVSNGGSGNIYRGFLHDGTKVGIKCLKLQLNSIGDTEKHIKHAAKELYTWSKCKHPNIVQLIGMAKFRDQIAMVSPWMENGTLSGSLSRHPRLNRYEVCVQIAEGVAHLHASKIIHGDIKGSNILVSDDLIPKLADFGNSLVNETNPTLPFSDTTSPATMSMRWAAPEIFEGPIRSSYEADVYALGMSILEVISGSLPYRGLNDIAVMHRILAGIHPERSEIHFPTGTAQGDRLWLLLTRCWDHKPDNRPTASGVRDEIKAIINGNH